MQIRWHLAFIFLCCWNRNHAIRHEEHLSRIAYAPVRPYASPLRRRADSIQDGVKRHIIPAVKYAAQKITQEIAPSIGEAVIDISSKVVEKTIENFQEGADIIANKVIPTVEDTFVEIGNAAVPVVNKGIDVLEAGFQTGVKALSRTTTKGIDRLGNRVLGEQRHNRIKNIASNISGGVKGSLNSLTNAIKSFNPDEAETPQLELIYRPQVSSYESYEREYALRPIRYHHPIKGITELLGNTAYVISRQLIGQNLTDAIAPIARSVTKSFSQNLNLGEDRIVIDLQDGSPAQRSEGEIRSCVTPDDSPGYCRDLSDCPELILDLTVLRKSVCFKGLFIPGVCCPEGSDMSILKQSAYPHGTTPTREAPPILYYSPPTPPTVETLTVRPHNPPISSPFGAAVGEDALTRRHNEKFECGEPKIPTYRVVGGAESKRGQWPWMAAVFLHGPRTTEFWCGASLVSSRHIMTAAHCTRDSRGKTFSPSQFSVRLGDYNIFSEVDDYLSNPRTYRVVDIQAHPDFKFHGFYNDVALLTLEKLVKFTEYILPVCLPPDYMAGVPVDYLVGETPTVIGYGTTFYGGKESTALREAQLPIWRNGDCNDAYFQPITSIFLCAGFAEGGKDACQGDSGGPLQLYKDGKWIQIGIVSFGNRCAEPGYPGVYTRISQFTSWLRPIISQ